MGTAVGLFQTYHERENVITDNVVYFLKMIQRLDGRAYTALLVELFDDDAQQDDFDDVFELQPAAMKTLTGSVPDACIERDSYKIVVETKGNGASFSEPQLKGHMEYLSSHGNDSSNQYKDHRLLLTLDKGDFPGGLLEGTMTMAKNSGVQWRHLRFMDLAVIARQACSGTTNEVLLGILDEFDNYLDREDLIPSTAVIMKMVLAGKAHQLNEGTPGADYGVYFHPAERRGYSFNKNATVLGFYWQKSIQEIAQIQVVAKMTNGDIRRAHVEYRSPDTHTPDIEGEIRKDTVREDSGLGTVSLSEVEIAAASKAIDKAEREFGWNLHNEPYYVYLTEPFVQTDFPKTSPRAPLGVKLFNLDAELNPAGTESTGSGAAAALQVKDMSTKAIAEQLRSCSWQ